MLKHLQHTAPKLASGSDHSPVVKYRLDINFDRDDDEVHSNNQGDERKNDDLPELVIKQRFDLGLGGCNWRGATLLARVLTHPTVLDFLSHLHRTQPGRQEPTSPAIAYSTAAATAAAAGFSAIELGAGTGFVSCAAAAAPNFFRQIIATEINDPSQDENVFPLLESNISSNFRSVIQPLRTELKSFPVTLTALPLSWGEMELGAAAYEQVAGRPFDFVIGSEVVYSHELNDLLLATLLALCATPSPRTGLSPTCILSNDTRAGDAAEHFFSRARKFFDVDRLPDEMLQICGAGDWLPLQTSEEGVFVLRRRHGMTDHRSQMARFRRADAKK